MEPSPAGGSFEAFVAPSERRRVIAAGILAALVIPLFGVTDLLVYPEQVRLLWTLRLLITLTLLPLTAGAYFAKTYRQVTALGVAMFLALSGGLAAMLPFVGGHHSEYYGGMCQVFVGAAVLFTWRLWVGAASFAVALLCYAVPIFFEPKIDLPVLVSHSSFLFGIALIALVCMRVRVGLAEQAWRANQELKALQSAKDRMFQNISHEFRTPLALVLAPVESLLDAPARAGGPDDRPLLQTIRDNALRLLNLINDLLSMAKLSTVQVVAEKSPVPIGVLLERLHRDAQPLAKRAGLELVLDVPSPLPSYLADGQHLEKVVLNLLSNAFKFTPAGGRVRLAGQDDARGLTLSVTDSGPGIASQARAQLFGRFQQLDASSTRQFGGSGIGLALVKELMGLMGGDVSVDSTVGRGSTFSIHLPATLRTEQTPAAAEPEGGTVLAVLSRQAAYAALAQERRTSEVWKRGERGPRVLVAEDDPGLAREVLGVLGTHCRVSSVANGRLALEHAKQLPPHLIVSDVMMPEMDGLQLVAAVRDSPALRETPIILLTARAELEDRVAGRALGVDTYLAKPFHPRELVAAVEGLLRSRMRLVGPWLLHRTVGAGGQSEIHLGEHVQSGELAAVKLLGRTATTPSARERLKREAEVLERLTHPNVVRVLGHGFIEDRAYLATEFLNGSTLGQLIETHGPLRAGIVAAVGIGLADGLGAVHVAGLVHRDVKCANVMVIRGTSSLRERVKLIDFGIVKGQETADLTGADQLVGTAAYLSPERVKGAAATPESDIYAAGVAMHAMCTGQVPFRDRNPAAMLQAIVEEGIPPLPTPHGVPSEFSRIIARATARDSSQRWSSAAALRTALEELRLDPGDVRFIDSAAVASDVVDTLTT